MRLAIIGAGRIGSGVAELAHEYGHEVTAMSDSRGAVIDPDGIDITAALERKKQENVIGDQPVEDAIEGPYDVLVETTSTAIGDAEPAFSHIRTALERNRHVVLGNKGPMAERYRDIYELEHESSGSVRFEATVGGVMPVLSTLEEIGADRISGVRGVFSGFANFVLSRMAAEGLGYEHVLAEAQDLRSGEFDPTFDVEGIDTALSCTIVANVLGQTDTAVTLDDVKVEGITEIPGSALNLAKEDGKTARLVGEVIGDEIRVGPRLVAESDALAVTGARTVVQLETRHAGQVNVSGGGDVPSEVATAILMDVSRIEN